MNLLNANENESLFLFLKKRNHMLDFKILEFYELFYLSNINKINITKCIEYIDSDFKENNYNNINLLINQINRKITFFEKILSKYEDDLNI